MNSKRMVAAWMLFSLMLHASDGKDIVWQVSTLDALMTGIYDGEVLLRDAGIHGDFGIGTYQGLNGEMVLVDGRFHQVLADGSVRIPGPETRTPFAAVTFFDQDLKACLEAGMDYPAVQKLADGMIPTLNMIYAIRIRGRFSMVRTRSVPEQARPYKPLAGILKEQPALEHREVEGVMVGFRFPAWFAGIQSPGYHFHFLTRDRDRGGHVLEFKVDKAEMELDVTESFHLALPKQPDFYNADLGGGK
ncbi:acetolactate decarboxylase [bacterium]|nr:acetolactate decarboxylase [bacterium]